MKEKKFKWIGFSVVIVFIVAVLLISGTMSTWITGMQFVTAKEDVKPHANELDATFQTTFNNGIKTGELDKQLLIHDDMTLHLVSIEQHDSQVEFIFESRGVYQPNSASIISVADQAENEEFAKIKLVTDDTQVELEPKTNHGINHRKGDQVTYTVALEQFEAFRSSKTTLKLEAIYLTEWINFKQLIRGL